MQLILENASTLPVRKEAQIYWPKDTVTIIKLRTQTRICSSTGLEDVRSTYRCGQERTKDTTSTTSDFPKVGSPALSGLTTNNLES